MAGGWNPQQVQRYKSVALPEKLKCMGCQSTQPISNFTETQMNRLRKKLATQGQTALLCHTARCLSCTGGLRPTEITCIGCKVTKPLEAYSKVQRIEWDNARCKSCIGTSLMAVSWTEHCEKVSAKEYSDDISDIASTINESEGGVRLPTPSIFPVLSKPHPTMFPESQEKLGGGVWIECSSVMSPDDDTVDDTMSTTSTATQISANTLGASSAAKYSGWNFSALKEENHRPTLPGAKPQSKAWAKVKSADPARDARILRRSDPMWSPEQDENTVPEPSLGSMVASRDKSKLHKEITEENDY